MEPRPVSSISPDMGGSMFTRYTGRHRIVRQPLTFAQYMFRASLMCATLGGIMVSAAIYAVSPWSGVA